jgi:hypothetical protein
MVEQLLETLQQEMGFNQEVVAVVQQGGLLVMELMGK